jgi:hypothetical protein
MLLFLILKRGYFSVIMNVLVLFIFKNVDKKIKNNRRKEISSGISKS